MTARGRGHVPQRHHSTYCVHNNWMATGVLGKALKGPGSIQPWRARCPFLINTAKEKSNYKPSMKATLSHKKYLVNWVLSNVALW